ncbi:MAG: AAA family ATPase [Spirochaetaceae bacterium]|nr:AAA family ATPase [Spirochaetaceae bacterium]
MQILGIYLEEAEDNVRKNLTNKTWYGFYEKQNLHEIYKAGKPAKIKKEYEKQNKNLKQFYDYKNNKQEFSINAIVGKNGSGKSTLLDIQNRIINNFAIKIKEKFPDNNKCYKIIPIKNLKAELFYEIKNIIHCIRINNNDVEFSNEENCDLFDKIKTLENLSNYSFYTITCNYSIYTDYPKWKEKLYHKNDGYFTPIVLVPYRINGDIEMEREKKLAEKRVQTLSILLFKDGNDFIENFIPYKFLYKLKDLKYYKEIIAEKIDDLCHSKYTTLYLQDQKQYPIRFNYICSYLRVYWTAFFDSNYKDFSLKEYCKEYLIYKTLKVFLNYESVSNTLRFNEITDLTTNQINLPKLHELIKNTIETELWDESNINYINLKILMCKKFLEHTCINLYKPDIQNELKITDFYKDPLVKDAHLYDEMFILLLPDFFEWHFYYEYKKEIIDNTLKIKPDNGNNPKDENEKTIMELSDMSSGEQQLYNSLSYIIYHIKNAQSNRYGNQSGKIPYKYFNVVFDETELYYHPEYQRRFINDIIKIFNRGNLDISGINITLVTHSPFILSDIPRANILALEHGSVSEKLNETLGANIYDLLENQFFMTSTIGETSRIFIENIISKYQNNEPLANDYEFYNNFINKIGDVYLKNALQEMIDSKRNIKFIDRKINYYENIINDLKKQKAEIDEKN